MKRSLALLLTTAAAPLMADEIAVATDIQPVASLVKMVGGDAVDVTNLVDPDQDVHHVTLRPSQAKAIGDADAIFAIGPGLAPWFFEAVESIAPETHAISLTDVAGTHVIEYAEGEHDDHDDHGHDDHKDDKHDDHDDHGHEDHKDDKHDDHDDHGHDDHDEHDHAFDLHTWLDPNNALVWIDAIAAELAEIAPEKADMFAANAENAKSEINAAKEETSTKLTAAGEIAYATAHNALKYFEDGFELDVHMVEIKAQHGQIAPKSLTEAVEHMKEDHIECIITDPAHKPKTLNVLAENTGAKVINVDIMGRADVAVEDIYITLIKDLAAQLESCAHDHH